MSSQAAYDAYRRREVLRLRRSLNRIQDEAALLRRDIAARRTRQRKFNPDQPRVPAGNTGGGQWTSGGGGGGSGFGLGLPFGGGLGEFGEGFSEGFAEDMGGGLFVDPTGEASWSSFSEGWSADGAVFERDIVNRDGSAIQSEYAASREAGFDERQTVRLESGEKVSFETTDRVQTIRYGGVDGEVVGRTLWTPSGPEPDASVQPAFAPMIAAPGVIALGGAILFGWQSQQNGVGGQQAVMGFNARDFATSGVGRFDLSYVGNLTEAEVKDACYYMPNVQQRLDNVVEKAGSPIGYGTPQAYGTAVHAALKRNIDQWQGVPVYAERSFLKETAAKLETPRNLYGVRDTIRIDVLELADRDTLCVYDIKTGDAGLPYKRSDLIAQTLRYASPNIRRIIVMEMRSRS